MLTKSNTRRSHGLEYTVSKNSDSKVVLIFLRCIAYNMIISAVSNRRKSKYIQHFLKFRFITNTIINTNNNLEFYCSTGTTQNGQNKEKIQFKVINVYTRHKNCCS